MKRNRPTPLLTEKQKEEIIKLYDEGYGTATIGRMLKVSIQRTLDFLKEKGIARDRKQGMAKRLELDKKKATET